MFHGPVPPHLCHILVNLQETANSLSVATAGNGERLRVQKRGTLLLDTGHNVLTLEDVLVVESLSFPILSLMHVLLSADGASASINNETALIEILDKSGRRRVMLEAEAPGKAWWVQCSEVNEEQVCSVVSLEDLTEKQTALANSPWARDEAEKKAWRVHFRSGHASFGSIIKSAASGGSCA